jgi:hypothetical protein
MSTPSKLLEQLQLAEASYVLFDGMTYGDQQLLLNRLLNIGGSLRASFPPLKPPSSSNIGR